MEDTHHSHTTHSPLLLQENNNNNNNNKVSLLYSKSKVYVHPSSDPEANMVGYLSIVERAPNDYLLAWTPETLIPFCDREAFVFLDSCPPQTDGSTPQESPPSSSQSSKRRDVLVSLPNASQHSLYATSIPVSTIHSVRVQPPSLSSWYGFLIINMKDGAGDAPLPFWFHDDESDSTMREGPVKWGGDEIVIMLEKLVGGVWSSMEFGLFYLHINDEPKEILANGKLPYGKKKEDWEIDPLKMDPLVLAVKEAKWNILEGFSKVTRFYRNSAAQILDHPLGRPLVPFLHPKLAALATSVPARTVMNDFEGARLYLAKWAAGVAAQAKIEQEKEANSNHGSVNDVWEEATEEDGGFGVWEVLNSDSALPPPEAKRTEPITPEEWLSFYDEEGMLKKSKNEIAEMVFRGGIENDIRLDVWKYFLGFWSWGSSEAERIRVTAEKTAAYHELKSKWSSLSPETLDADEQFVEQRHRIEKDVARTDRTVPFFSDSNGPIGRRSSVSECGSPTLNDNLIVLKELLLTYNYYNTKLGYVQGMSDLLSPILSVMRDEVDAFWCFVGFMERMEVNFLRDQSGMRAQLETLEALMKFMDPALHKHFERADSTNLFCCFRWLLIWFKREFDFDKVLRLWEVLFSDYLCKDMHLFVALAILDTHRDVFIDHLRNFDEILKYINDLSGTIDVEETLKRAEVLFALFERRLTRLERMQATEANIKAVRQDEESGPMKGVNEEGTRRKSTVPALHPLICKLVKRYRGSSGESA